MSGAARLPLGGDAGEPSGYQGVMTITNALASVAVRDLQASANWYETLLGSGNRPMPEVVEWQLQGGGGLQLYQGPDRAGHCSCTLIVTDIDETARQLRDSGVAPDAEPSRNPRVDTIMIRDPDGNSIAFARPKDDGLAH